MDTVTPNKPTTYFWIVGFIASIWYAFSAYGYFVEAFATDDALPADTEIENYLPLWYLSAYAIAAFTGLVASFCLLIRKKLAYILFIISFLALGIQQFYVLTEINPRDIFISLSSLVIGAYLIWFSRRCMARKWIS